MTLLRCSAPAIRSMALGLLCAAACQEPKSIELGETECAPALPWYADADGDGFGDPTAVTTACDAPPGTVPDATDCDDADATVHPGAVEVCDERDDDCDGVGDLGPSWYGDADGDGFGDPTSVTTACDAPPGTVPDATDCDDADATVHPGAVEVCDERDDDCDGLVDDLDPDLAGAPAWYPDVDGDGYGDAADVTTACDAPPGTVPDATDCDDADADVHPGAVVHCRGDVTDGDCDGVPDDADPDATDATASYVDADGDGFGDPATAVISCDTAADALVTGGDCDDADPSVHPAAVETCDDGVDQDCSGADHACDDGSLSGRHSPEEATDAVYTSTVPNAYFGMTVTGGDLDGDGWGDLVVAAPNTTSKSSDEDGVRAYYGPVSAGEHSGADVGWIMGSPSRGSLYGTILENLGDLDGDGRDDLYIGDQSSDGRIFLGWDGGGATTAAESADLAPSPCLAASVAGDVTGGGARDWLCGLRTGAGGAGTVTLYAGTDLSTSVAVIRGARTPAGAGWSVGGGADIDGDGATDVIVGAPSLSEAEGGQEGAAFVYYGPVAGRLTTDDADVAAHGAGGDELGIAVGSPGDVDGDGRADLALSARLGDLGADVDAGAVYLVPDPGPGAFGAVDIASATIFGAGAGDTFGDRGVCGGDVDGDGALDLYAGEFTNVEGGTNAGAVWLVYGPVPATVDLSTDTWPEWLGGGGYWSVGAGFAVLPDVSGDGRPDLAFSTNAYDDSYRLEGAVRVVFGR